jgi:hypothetical protein
MRIVSCPGLLQLVAIGLEGGGVRQEPRTCSPPRDGTCGWDKTKKPIGLRKPRLLVGEALAPEVSSVALGKLLLTMFLYCTVALLLVTNTIDHGHRVRFQKAIG